MTKEIPNPHEERDRGESFVVETSLPNERLDTFLARRYPAVSRVAIQRMLDAGDIKVDGGIVKPTHHPRAGQEVSIVWPEAGPTELLPEDLPLDVLFEDKDLIVLNKAPGMVVHPSAGHEQHTVVNALLHHCKGQLSGIGGVQRPGIVHRLDIDTSGCLVAAKNDFTHLGLQKQFASRTMEKIYLAVVCGEVSRASGEIQANIARHPDHRKRMAVASDVGGRESRTEYRVIERLNGTTLLEVTLHTGRTHQIRVHFQHLGYPLLGDLTYGKRQTIRVKELTGYEPPRIMLHAWKLAFVHPRSQRLMAFEAPVPADMKATLGKLRVNKDRRI